MTWDNSNTDTREGSLLMRELPLLSYLQTGTEIKLAVWHLIYRTGQKRPIPYRDGCHCFCMAVATEPSTGGLNLCDLLAGTGFIQLHHPFTTGRHTAFKSEASGLEEEALQDLHLCWVPNLPPGTGIQGLPCGRELALPKVVGSGP